MKIIFDPTSLHQNKRGSITGVIYFDFNQDQKFPMDRWNDFVVVVAGWWLQALNDLQRGVDQVQLRLMDGPYWVNILQDIESNIVRLEYVEDRSGAGVIYESVLSIVELRSCVENLGREIAATCERAKLESVDLDDLNRLLNSISSAS